MSKQRNEALTDNDKLRLRELLTILTGDNTQIRFENYAAEETTQDVERMDTEYPVKTFEVES